MFLNPIPLEDVARAPVPGGVFPTGIAFSPDGRLVTFLNASQGSLVRQLFAYEIETGQTRLMLAPPGGGTTEENLSLDELLRRERLRQLDLGVTSYRWAPNGTRLLLPMPDGIYIVDVPGEAPRLLVSSEQGPLLDPQFSPDGVWVAYVQGGEVWVIAAAGGQATRLTNGAEAGLTHGLAEYIAQEEMQRGSGLWWSGDSRFLAFEEVDERHIPVYRIVHQGKDATGDGAQEDHHYPFAGQANARVRLGVMAREGGEPIWMDLGEETDIYLARVNWLPDGALLAQVENRAQDRLDLVRLNPATGERKVLFCETSGVWVNLHDLFWPLKKDELAGGFVYGSERTGFRHLYLFDREGNLVRSLTNGEWMVDALVGLDEERGLVYFSGTKESPVESHLYAVPLAGGEIRPITREVGMHYAYVDQACRHFVDLHDSPNQPTRVTLRSLEDGSELGVLHEPADDRLNRLSLEPPEITSFTNRAGELLYVAIFRPSPAFGPGPHPTVIYVYGGPHVQVVTRSWRVTANMRVQALRRLGYLVAVIDNRGSARRGLAFEGAIRHRMGDIEVQDQVDGVGWLVANGLADPARVGVYGWSYGGYMSLMCLARAPEVFRCGVAGAPVTHWDGYDTHYTERYMGLPQENREGYKMSSVMAHVQNMTGRLLLVHGLIDENVHFRHTARLINALIQARKTYELLLFPDERHLPRRLADRVYMEEQILAFFQRELGTPQALVGEA